MPPSEYARGLEELPETTRALAWATLQSGRQLIADSAAATEHDALPTLLAIRRSALQLRLYLERRGEKIVFFFWKRKQRDVRLIEASLQVAMRAVEDDGYLPPAADDCSYRVFVPTFLRPAPSPDSLRRHEALISFVDKLRGWLTGSQPPMTQIPLTIPKDPLTWNHVHTTLRRFVEGYLQIEIAMMLARTESVLPPLDRVTPAYLPEDYKAEIALCLDQKGRFAPPDEEDPIALTMKLRVARDAGALVAHIELGPPDFLCSGALHEAFLQALSDDAATARRLREVLKLDTERDFGDFLSSARPHAVVFRTAHGSHSDTDTVVLPGLYRGVSRTVILITEVTVKSESVHSAPQVTLQKVNLGYDSLHDEDQMLDDKTAAYFTRLCAAFADWGRLVA
jgi:hypothetical protein